MLSLAALLVLIPSGIFFFHSGEIASDAERIEQLSQPTKIAETIAREKREPGDGIELKVVTIPTKTPAELLEEAFAALPSMEQSARDSEVDALIAKLRAAGPAGLNAVRQFLAGAKDVPFRNGFSFSNGQLAKAPSLRMALIDALRGWSGSTGALLEVLKSNATVFEMTLAIRGLEMQFPGTYRNEAIESLKRRIDDPNAWNSGRLGEEYFFDVARYFQGEEILPQVHAMVVKEPLFRAPEYVRMLDGFSPEARGVALDRLFAEPKFTEMFIANPHMTNQFSYVDDRMRAFTVHAFTQVWQAPQKLKALEYIAGVPPDHLSDFFIKPGESVWTRSQSESDLREASARKMLLAELEPAADTPELQEALKKGRAAVTSEIGRQMNDRRHENDPPADVEFASGEGKATIKGRRIENIEIRSAPIIPKNIDGEDSTPEQPR